MISIMLPRAAVAADRVEEVLKSETIICDPERPEVLPEQGEGVLSFDHVSFKYPGADEDVLQDITFTARPGQTTAIIGSTGSGKSTLVNLIPRFYDVTEGKITLDGIDIRDIKQHDLREKLGYVPQKGVLFSGNIASNIMFGNQDGTEEEMKEAAEIAQATEFIETKPEGYESPIAQGGSNVSGGQKQRAAVARALITNPQIILADEPTGALDSRAADNLLDLFGCVNADGQTILMVTHSVKAASHARRVLFLRDGEVYHQLYRGEESQEAMFARISDTLTVLAQGGEVHA